MKRALLTGATGGIGVSLALLLAEEGYLVTLVGRSEPALCALQQRVSSGSSYFVADHSDLTSQKKLEDFVESQSFDLIINNAAFGLYGECDALPLSHQLEMVDVNVKAVVGITHAGVRSMVQEARPGVIVNISSLAGFFPMPLLSIYGATKAFVTSFSKALDFELSDKKIRVLAFCPGMVDTLFAEKAAGGKRSVALSYQMSSKEAAQAVVRQIKKGRSCLIPGWRGKLSYFMGSVFPQKWQMKMVYNSIKKRI